MPISGGFTKALATYRQLGFKNWWHQIYYRADASPGRLVGTDLHGNRYFEDLSAGPYRNRFVLYKNPDYDASQVPPEWHAWHSGIRDLPPNEDPVALESVKAWQPEHRFPNISGTRGKYVPYSTTAPKQTAWEPHVARRQSA